MKKEKLKEIKNIDPFAKYEINILKNNDTIETFEVDYGSKDFKYDRKKYKINDKMIYLLPNENKKESLYKPILYYKEGNDKPLNIEYKNRGIPSRTLHMLWNHTLYAVIVTFETDRLNKAIILLLIINAIMLGIKFYFTFSG